MRVDKNETDVIFINYIFFKGKKSVRQKARGGILSAFYLCFKSVLANWYSEHRFISVLTVFYLSF